MASVRQVVDPSLLVVAVFSRHRAALDWAQDRLSWAYGPVARASSDFSFHHTGYYREQMGPDLIKRLVIFQRLVAVDSLPDIKHFTNRLEVEGTLLDWPETRPLNIDPGLLELGKFLLATTKDKDHRIYLRDGIFAEVTLRFQDKEYHPWPWTYADYREPHVRQFLKEAREYYRSRLSADPQSGDFCVPGLSYS